MRTKIKHIDLSPHFGSKFGNGWIGIKCEYRLGDEYRQFHERATTQLEVYKNFIMSVERTKPKGKISIFEMYEVDNDGSMYIYNKQD